jgi:hypothetical protein
MISTTEDYCHLRFMMVIIVEFVDSILGRIEMTHNNMIGSMVLWSSCASIAQFHCYGIGNFLIALITNPMTLDT